MTGDIRDRDINARGGYDPRYDKRPDVVAPPMEAAVEPVVEVPVAEPVVEEPAPIVEAPVAPRAPIPEPIPFNPAPPPEGYQPIQPPESYQPIPPPSQSPAAPRAVTPGRLIVTGDSVATGLGWGGAEGSDSSDAQWSRSSAKQLAYMLRKGPEYYRGAQVVLSSGILNSGDIRSVESQLRFLTNAGATVRLVGTPFQGIHSVYNRKLKALADKYGVTFLGGYESVDGVHPAYYENYRKQHGF